MHWRAEVNIPAMVARSKPLAALLVCCLCVVAGPARVAWAAAAGPAGAVAPAAAPAADSGAAAGPAASLHPATRRYEMNVSLSRAAPDCFQKTLILANDQFGFLIEVTQGEVLEVCPFSPLFGRPP